MLNCRSLISLRQLTLAAKVIARCVAGVSGLPTAENMSLWRFRASSYGPALQVIVTTLGDPLSRQVWRPVLPPSQATALGPSNWLSTLTAKTAASVAAGSSASMLKPRRDTVWSSVVDGLSQLWWSHWLAIKALTVAVHLQGVARLPE